ncbi:MAG: type II toxin-antitoxin system PemK/MazF family toxin [Clostridia bacterium]|nr:type II toxin-antitoxin system PemK/MazF family toxin [Clostridia bacterium]
MAAFEQGDLLMIDGIRQPVMVVSNNVFNESGKAIVCPIVAGAQDGPFHIWPKDSPVNGVVLCEQVRYLDLAARRYHKLTTMHKFDIMDISDAVVSMIEYQ